MEINVFYEKKSKSQDLITRTPNSSGKEIEIELPSNIPENSCQNDDVNARLTLTGSLDVNTFFLLRDDRNEQCYVNFKDEYSW